MAKKKLVKGLWTKSEVSLLRKLFPSNPTAKALVLILKIRRLQLVFLNRYQGDQ